MTDTFGTAREAFFIVSRPEAEQPAAIPLGGADAVTIEITRAKSIYQYRVSPTDTLAIERRENRHNARWVYYARRDTPPETKRLLLSLERGEDSAAQYWTVSALEEGE